MVQLNLSIRCSTGANFDVTSSDSVTVLEFKQTLASPQLSDIPVEQQRLIYKGRVLKDELTLDSYGKLFYLLCGVF
jgi:ubiquilin